jgi:hypothetical protein
MPGTALWSGGFIYENLSKEPAMTMCNMAAILSAALLVGSVSLANAECGHAIKGGVTVAAAKAASAPALSAQAKKSAKNKNDAAKTGQNNCPPEHKKAGHC